MNRLRRKELDQVSDLLNVVLSDAAEENVDWSDLRGRLDDNKNTIEGLQAEEQDAYDNMPESFQSGDKGDAAQAAIDNMNSAISELESAITFTDNETKDEESTEEFRGNLQSAMDYLADAAA